MPSRRQRSLAQARLAGLPELTVEPLSEQDSAALLDEHAPGHARHLRARVFAEAGGNPRGFVELAGVAARFGENRLPPTWLPLTTRLERSFVVQVAELPALTQELLLSPRSTTETTSVRCSRTCAASGVSVAEEDQGACQVVAVAVGGE
jgi:hypothetical protein